MITRPIARVRIAEVLVAAGLALGTSGFACAADPERVASSRGAAPMALRGLTERVSVTGAGREANHGSVPTSAGISSDGRYVAFVSLGSNLVPGDTNGKRDVFVRDRVGRTTDRVSIGRNGEQANGRSFSTAISGDGRYVAFLSEATNVVPGDTNRKVDVFVHDRRTSETRRVSVDSGGRDANADAAGVGISLNGRFVVFSSTASNLVAGDTNGEMDAFVHDRRTGRTARVSVGGAGVQADRASHVSSISADGRYVVFRSFATNLVGDDGNGLADVFARDRVAQTTERVNVGERGEEANADTFRGTISADGRYVVFRSAASTLVPGDTNAERDPHPHHPGLDVFVRDRRARTTERVSLDPFGKEVVARFHRPAISADGRYVVFRSSADDLVAGDTNGVDDIFLRDRKYGVTGRVSVASDGRQANGGSVRPAISADGSHVAFFSYATNLVPGDSSGQLDVFVHRRGAAELVRELRALLEDQGGRAGAARAQRPLTRALAALGRGDRASACGALRAFERRVSELDTALGAPEARTLARSVVWMRGELRC